MVRQPFDLFRHMVGGEPLDGLHDLGMQGAPPLLEEPAVCHLVGEGMLEGVFALGEEARLIEELGSLQVGEAVMQRLLGQLGNGLQERQGHLSANHGGRLQQTLVFGGNRSIRAASTACTVAGTWMVGSACARR